MCQSRTRLIHLRSADATLIYNGVPVPVTTGVRFRAINDQGNRPYKTTIHDYLFDTGLRGEMGEFGDYFKSWNWELGFRYSWNAEQSIFGGGVSASGLREALLDTDPATAFNPFLGILGRNSSAAISRVYVTSQKAANSSYLSVTSLSMAICSISRRGRSPLRPVSNTVASDGRTIPTLSAPRLARRAVPISNLHG